MSNYPFRYRAYTVIALGHLAIVGLGASDVGYDFAGWLAPVVEYYSNLSGASNSYGFFAPGVGHELRALFEAIDLDGRHRSVRLETGENHEADLRRGNIIDQFENDNDDPVALRRSLSASLAGAVFGHDELAREVVVRLETFDPVSMREFREGKRPQWNEVYEGTFRTDGRQ